MRTASVLAILFGSLALASGSACAEADVFEIANDGTVHNRSGSGLVASADIPQYEVGDGDPQVSSAPDVPADALTTVAAPDVPTMFQPSLLAAAKRYDVSPSLLAALVWQESRWRPGALSNKGAIGLAQLMPTTARALAVDPRDAGANLDGAAHYLRQLLDLFDGDVERALAAYNAGPGRVLKANGVPAIRETRAYVSTIIDHLAQNGSTTGMGEIR